MILAIESSCDESALALFDPAKGIVGDWVHSQIEKHADYGGVVPDLASREHLANFPGLLRLAHETLAGAAPTHIAVTHGPGLAGCLALGVALAKSLALAWDAPLLGVNHLSGHVWSPFIALHREKPAAFDGKFQALLPHLGMIVSGGNTLLFVIGEDRKLAIIGQTRDDAAGEALDKGAKLLGLGYPGGPNIEQLARDGDPRLFDFPRAFYGSPDIAFSFSGLKTSLRYKLEELSDTEVRKRMPDLCASYQQAVIDALARKTRQALKQHAVRSLGLSGGVSNNSRLRAAFGAIAAADNLPLHIAEPRHTGDNAAMIAFAAWMQPAPADASLTIEPSLALA